MRLEKITLSKSYVVALSQYTSQMFCNITSVQPKGVLPVPINRLVYHAKDRKTDINKVGFIHRFNDPRKNIDLFLKVIEICAKQKPRVKYFIGGDMPDKSLLRKTKSMGIDQHIIWVGYLSQTELSKLYRTLAVFVITSHQEGLCITGLEAMSCGVPVISTRCGGPEEYIENGINGFLCCFEDKDIANHLLLLLGNLDKIKTMSNACINTVVRSYSIDTFNKHFWEHFNQMHDASAKIF